MANKKVSELTSYSSVLSTDYIVIDRPEGTANTRLSAIANYILNLPLTASISIDNSVTTEKIADNAITTVKISAGSVTTEKIADNAINSSKIADNSITNIKILNSTIQGTKIANSTITNTNMAANSIGATELQNNSVTLPKLNQNIILDNTGIVLTTNGIALSSRVVEYTTNTILSLIDTNSIIEANSNTGIIITIPTDAVTNFNIGTNIVIYQKGTGQVTLSSTSPTILVSNGSKVKTSGQYAAVALFKLGANRWLLGGDLTI